MGNDRCNIPCKPRYDITMSRRTRKPVMSVEEADQNPTAVLIISPDEESDAKDGVVHDKETESFPAKVGVEEDPTQATDESDEPAKRAVQETRVEDDENIESKLSGSKNSLGQHFKGEEKQLQLVTMKQAKEGIEGVKLKGMIVIINVLNQHHNGELSSSVQRCREGGTAFLTEGSRLNFTLQKKLGDPIEKLLKVKG
ncbi:hypothetical protein OIU76_020647 [Salix suchowensis]|nr:hypothetical protein OIU76_020647 [Salix suchowensis]